MRIIATLFFCGAVLPVSSQQVMGSKDKKEVNKQSEKTFIISASTEAAFRYDRFSSLAIQSGIEGKKGKDREELYRPGQDCSERNNGYQSYQKRKNKADDDSLKMPVGGSVAGMAYDYKSNRIFYIPQQDLPTDRPWVHADPSQLARTRSPHHRRGRRFAVGRVARRSGARNSIGRAPRPRRRCRCARRAWRCRYMDRVLHGSPIPPPRRVRHPTAVQRLVLIGGTPGIENDEERRRRRLDDEMRARRIEEIGVEAFIDEWLQIASDPAPRCGRCRTSSEQHDRGSRLEPAACRNRIAAPAVGSPR